MQTVRLSEQINPHFYRLWHSQKDHIIAKGGRGSFKSSVISLRLAVSMYLRAEGSSRFTGHGL